MSSHKVIFWFVEYMQDDPQSGVVCDILVAMPACFVDEAELSLYEADLCFLKLLKYGTDHYPLYISNRIFLQIVQAILFDEWSRQSVAHRMINSLVAILPLPLYLLHKLLVVINLFSRSG